jgi:hypothetical protein
MVIQEVGSFVNIINSYDNIEYLLSIIMCSAAPTIAKEKVSSLLNFSSDNHNLQKTWKEHKDYIKDILNIDFFELKKDENNTIVLFYNKEELEKILKQKQNIKFLKRFGYNEEMNIKQCILHLSTRFQNTCPHEIGIFLGYPVEDVACFINYPNEQCLMVGYWKVYHNVEEAKYIFDKYDEIKYSVINMILEGLKPIEIIDRYLHN